MARKPKDKGPQEPSGRSPKKSTGKELTLNKKVAGAIRTKLTQEKKAKALAGIVATGTVLGACERANIARITFYEWLDKDPDFALAVEQAKLEAIELAEQVCLERAKAKSDLLLMFWLKAHKPEMYKDVIRQEQTGENGGPIKTELRIIIEGAPQARPILTEPS